MQCIAGALTINDGTVPQVSGEPRGRDVPWPPARSALCRRPLPTTTTDPIPGPSTSRSWARMAVRAVRTTILSTTESTSFTRTRIRPTRTLWKT
eukprot:3499038-Prymnesium_polylepis.2